MTRGSPIHDTACKNSGGGVQVIPWPVLLAFAPALWRAAAVQRREESRLDVRRLGWSDVAVETAFVLLLIAAFWFVPPVG